MSLKKCIIIVPVYREVPNELEQLSLKQLNTVIQNDNDICLVHPDWVNIDEYKSLLPDCIVSDKEYDNKYFKDTMTYSQLCLSYDFYNDYSDYEYMFVYQTDCWIFKNELEKFCDMKYDYIGPPIYSKYSLWPSFKTGNRPLVGNGGLSLRRIEKMKELTNPEGYIYNKVGKENYEKFNVEDVVICDVFSHLVYMNIPGYKLAETFGFDFFPENTNVNELIKQRQPMAAHRVFMLIAAWKNFIPEMSDEHIADLCKIEYEKWHEDFKRKMGIKE